MTARLGWAGGDFQATWRMPSWTERFCPLLPIPNTFLRESLTPVWLSLETEHLSEEVIKGSWSPNERPCPRGISVLPKGHQRALSLSVSLCLFLFASLLIFVCLPAIWGHSRKVSEQREESSHQMTKLTPSSWASDPQGHEKPTLGLDSVSVIFIS